MKLTSIITSFLILLLLGALLVSCQATRRVPMGEQLLVKNQIFVDGKPYNQDQLYPFVRPQANTRILGIPFGLYIYNAARPNPEQRYYEWLERHPKTHQFLNGWLSKKQVKRLGESFLVSGVSNQLRKMGEAPVLVDSTKIAKSKNTLEAYYKSIGYFNVEVTDSLQSRGEKKSEINYYIRPQQRYYVDSIQHRVASSELDSVYQIYQNKSFIKAHQPYRLSDFALERERITKLLRNNGFYTFQTSSISFDIKRDTVISHRDSLINITTQIDDLVERDGDEITQKPYRIHRLKKVRIFTDYDFNIPISELDSIEREGVIIYYKGELKYRPRILANASALKANQVYSDQLRTEAYSQLSNLRVFKYPNIEYKVLPDSLQNSLEANIYLTSLKKFALEQSLEAIHSNIQDYGLNFGTSFVVRNLFQGAETLELALHGNLGSQENAQDNDRFFNISEVGGDIRLNFPRILFFFNPKRIIPYRMNPRTTIQFGTSRQKNIGLDKQSLNAQLRYSWNPSYKNRNILQLVDAESVKNTNPENFFNVYQSSYEKLNSIAQSYGVDAAYFDANGNLDIDAQRTNDFINAVLSENILVSSKDRKIVSSIEERRQRISENNFILGSSFTFIHNQNKQYFESDFSQFRVKVEAIGYIPRLVSKIMTLKENDIGKKLVWGVPYSEYGKIETDYIKHWNLGGGQVLAMRTFFGIALPYGNSRSVPFSRSYFAGGSNDNRGWVAYSLGPGSSGSVNDFNEANMKLALNMEYRFPIAGAFKGALFADAGNIWNVLDETEDTTYKLDDWRDIQDIGIGTGIGLRYDFSFFVFRLDAGVKAYNPVLPINERWFNHINLSDIVYNIGINYPF